MCYFWVIMDTSLIINMSMLSCTSNVIPQCRRRWRLFIEDPIFVTSPSSPQSLPIYAETMASNIPLSIANLNVMIVGF